MRTVFLAGGIASGKSTAARILAERGAVVIDLDELSREALAPGSDLLPALADAFGADVLDDSGALRRGLLAERAFASDEGAATLEGLELGRIFELLEARLAEHAASDATVVVEVPLLDRMEPLFGLADAIAVVDVPLELRRERALARGMAPSDFDARAARQPSDAYLRAHADYLIGNAAGPVELEGAVSGFLAWLEGAARG